MNELEQQLEDQIQSSLALTKSLAARVSTLEAENTDLKKHVANLVGTSRLVRRVLLSRWQARLGSPFTPLRLSSFLRFLAFFPLSPSSASFVLFHISFFPF